MSFELRSYQRDAIDTTYSRVAEGHRPIICAATGSGKTVIAAHIAREAVEQGKRVLWMTGREEIIRQAYATFCEVVGLRRIGVCCAALQHETPWWSYPEVSM